MGSKWDLIKSNLVSYKKNNFRNDHETENLYAKKKTAINVTLWKLLFIGEIIVYPFRIFSSNCQFQQHENCLRTLTKRTNLANKSEKLKIQVNVTKTRA